MDLVFVFSASISRQAFLWMHKSTLSTICKVLYLKVLSYPPVLSGTFSSYKYKLAVHISLNIYNKWQHIFEWDHMILFQNKVSKLREGSTFARIVLFGWVVLQNLHYYFLLVWDVFHDTTSLAPNYHRVHVLVMFLTQLEIFLSIFFESLTYFCILSNVSKSHQVSNRLITGKLLPSEKGLLNGMRFHFIATSGKYTDIFQPPFLD